MKKIIYTIKNEFGIHARPAGNLANLAKEFRGTKITVEKCGKCVDVTRLMMVMVLGARCGDTVTFTISGGDENAAAARLYDFILEQGL